MNPAKWILSRYGWKFVMNIPPIPQCVICVAPHTSNWDFILGELGIRSVGRKASFLMKDTWFFFPMGLVMRALGGIPVKREKSTHVTSGVVDEFKQHKHLWVAVTPEGTRSRNEHWHRGFLHIAREANVPLVLGYIDYAMRTVCIDCVFSTSDDIEADLNAIKRYYMNHVGRYPDKFATGL